MTTLLTRVFTPQRVDNYEYEMPSDFEDEDIDDEMAFTGGQGGRGEGLGAPLMASVPFQPSASPRAGRAA